MRHTRACCRLQGRAAKAIVRFHMAGSAQRLEKLSLLDPCTRFRGHLTAPTHCITCWTTRQLLQLPTRTSGTLCSPHPSRRRRHEEVQRPSNHSKEPGGTVHNVPPNDKVRHPLTWSLPPRKPSKLDQLLPCLSPSPSYRRPRKRTLARGRNMFKCSAEECTSANPAHSHFGTVN